jgi:hypothetical protein
MTRPPAGSRRRWHPWSRHAAGCNRL